MAYTVPDLPYDYNALEPHIDEQTMRIHHDKHHGAYVTNLNKALEGQDALAKLSIEELLAKISTVPDSIRAAVNNNGGGHSNHSIFWTIMAPAGKGGGGEPTGELAQAINSTFGSFATLKEKVNDAGVKRFGSGWSWLCVDNGGKLIIESFPNQDSPISKGYIPILGIDVWEHAYYLKYQNRRPDYLAAWWNVVNWSAVSDRFARAKVVFSGVACDAVPLAQIEPVARARVSSDGSPKGETPASSQCAEFPARSRLAEG